MTPRNIDLLVLTKRDSMNQQELDKEIEMLADLFYLVENSNEICIANEVIDVNQYKVFRKANQVRQALRNPQPKPFVFICNKN